MVVLICCVFDNGFLIGGCSVFGVVVFNGVVFVLLLLVL